MEQSFACIGITEKFRKLPQWAFRNFAWDRITKNVPSFIVLGGSVTFYNQAVLRRSFHYADIVKLNDPELLQVSHLFELGIGTDEMLAQRLLHLCDLRLVCITCGSRGSLLVTQDEAVAHNGFPVTVTDAVGAGDAFTACLAHHYLRGHSLQQINESANRFASWVATQRGATPPISTDKLQSIFNDIALG